MANNRGRKVVRVLEFEECKIATAAEEFYKHNKVKGLSEATQKAYKMYVGNFVKWLGEDVLLCDLTMKTFDNYIYAKMEEGNKAVSIATNMRHLKSFIKFCAVRDYMEELPLTIPKYETELKEPYTDAEMKKLLEKPRTKNWVTWRSWAMVNYFFGTGQRLSTVLNVKIKDLDFLNARVKLVWNKDKKQKYMPLSSATIRVLQEYIMISGLDFEDYLFPEYEGGQLKIRSAQDAIADYNKSKGVYKTSIHLFRHTFAKNYIMAGGNAMKLQKLLNHKQIETTMKYVNLYGTDIADDLDVFNPLDNFNRTNYTPTKRLVVNE